MEPQTTDIVPGIQPITINFISNAPQKEHNDNTKTVAGAGIGTILARDIAYRLRVPRTLRALASAAGLGLGSIYGSADNQGAQPVELEKTALTAVGKRLAAGVLSPEVISFLRSKGALRSAATYGAGLDRGNIAIAKDLGLGESVLAVLRDKRKMLVGISPPSNSDTVDIFPPRSVKVERLTGKLSNLLSTLAERGDSMRVLYTSFGRPKVPLKTRLTPGAVPVSTDSGEFHRILTYLGGGSRHMRSLFNRHELDELRALRSYERLTGRIMSKGLPISAAAPAILKRMNGVQRFGHLSPSVLLNEGRNAQGLGPTVLRTEQLVRSTPMANERAFMTDTFGDL